MQSPRWILRGRMWTWMLTLMSGPVDRYGAEARGGTRWVWRAQWQGRRGLRMLRRGEWRTCSFRYMLGVGLVAVVSLPALWWEGGALIGRSDDPIYISEVVSKSMVWSSATRGFLKRELMGEGFYRIRIFNSSSCRITGRTFPGWIRPL